MKKEKVFGLIILGIIIFLTFVNNLFAYQEISLNGTWEYIVSKQETPPVDITTGWQETYVPLLLKAAGGQDVWYKKRFSLPEDFLDKTIKLHFDAVGCFATVYLNGTKAGEHEGACEFFDMDITKYIDKKNELFVRVQGYSACKESKEPRLKAGH